VPASQQNIYDWLGDGIYFWENDPIRAMQWAQETAARKEEYTPAIIGAVIDLGNCIDLSTQDTHDWLRRTYDIVERAYSAHDLPLPTNDRKRSELDCTVINTFHALISDQGHGLNVYPYPT